MARAASRLFSGAVSRARTHTSWGRQGFSFKLLRPFSPRENTTFNRGDGKRARILLSRTPVIQATASMNRFGQIFTHKYVFRKLEPEVNQLLIELSVHPLHRLNQGVGYIISVCGTQKDGGCQAPQPEFSLRAFQNLEKNCQELLTHTTVSVCEFSKLQTYSDVMTNSAMVSSDPSASKELFWCRDHAWNDRDCFRTRWIW